MDGVTLSADAAGVTISEVKIVDLEASEAILHIRTDRFAPPTPTEAMTHGSVTGWRHLLVVGRGS